MRRGYTLLDPSPLTPGLTVGVDSGDVASLTILKGPVTAVSTHLGHAANALGLLTVTGPQGSLELTQQLRIGNSGTGFFELSEGASAINGTATLGAGGAAYGEGVVRGVGTQWTCDGHLTVGNGGVGDLTIEDGAVVTCTGCVVAQQLGTMGMLTVRGAGSSLVVEGPIDIGMSGFGSLVLEDGASLTNTLFAALGTFGQDIGGEFGEGGRGEAIVRGIGTTWTVEAGE